MIVVRNRRAGRAARRRQRPALRLQRHATAFRAIWRSRAACKEAGLDPRRPEWIETGSHRASVRAVAEEKADVAAIDAVCWALALRYEPEAVSRLKVIGQTPLRPGLPFITAVERDDSEVGAIRARSRRTRSPIR